MLKKENRLQHKATKCDIDVSNKRLLNEDSHCLVSNEGEIPFKYYLRINNENISSRVVAEITKNTFVL